MPRIRSLKPETPHDRKLATVSRDARLTFTYLISQADDDGLVKGTPRHLIGELFPYDADVTDRKLLGWIAELVAIGSVRWRKTVDGIPVVQLVNWEKHQRIANRGKPILAENLVDGEAGPPSLGPHEPRPKKTRKPSESLMSPSRGPRGADRERDLGEGEGKGSFVASAPLSRDPPSWVADATAIYAEHIGVLPHGRIGRALKPAVDAHGWDPDVRRWFTRYCTWRPLLQRDGSIWGDRPGQVGPAPRNTQFCSPEDFVKNLRRWQSEDAAPARTT